MIVALLAANAAAAHDLFLGRKFAAGDVPTSVAVAFLDFDMIPDIVTANARSNDVSVLLGNRSFQSAKTYAAGDSPEALVVADLDGDTVPDLVTANSGSDDVTVLLNLGEPIGFVPALSPGALVLLAALLAGTGSSARFRTRRMSSRSQPS